MRTAAQLIFLLALPLLLPARDVVTIESESVKLDAIAANPDSKPVVVAVMADSLHVHRNHLLLLRKETGRSFASIFVSELRARGEDDAKISAELTQLRRRIGLQLGATVAAGDSGIRPVFLVGSGVDHNSTATLFSITPEIGFDSSHVAVVLGAPYYRVSAGGSAAGGIGDVYASVFLRGRASGFDFGSALTVGAPTGDRSKGFGAGKTTLDGTATISRRLDFASPWVSAGFANFVFNNAGYQRFYITDGNAAHFDGGVAFALPHKVALGVGGFGLEPIGRQTMFSQTMGTSGAGAGAGSAGGGGMMPGGAMPPGMSNGGSTTMPATMPANAQAQMSVVAADAVRDYGATASLSIPLGSGLSLRTAVARSVAFHLTTVSIGVTIDVGHFLFPGKRF